MPAHPLCRPRLAPVVLGLLLLPMLIAGCGGGGGSTALLGGSFAGHTYSATGLSLGQFLASLQVTTSATTRTAAGTLAATSIAQPRARRAAAAQSLDGRPNCRGTYDPATGALQLSGQFTEPNGATHTFSISGTLPVPPATAGSLSITLDGVTYGPFLFGDNSGDNSGTGGTGGGTTTPIADSLGITFSDAAGVNGDTSPLNTTTLNGNFLKLTPTFQLTAFYEVPGSGGVTRQLIFEGPVTNGPVTAGTVFTYTPAQGEGEGVQNLYYVEKNAAGVETASWVSVGGQLRIDAVQADGIRFTLLNVQMQPSPSPKNATGTFLLKGSGALRDPSAS